jgi:hypothetical protein
MVVSNIATRRACRCGRALFPGLLLFILIGSTGCQTQAPVTNRRLIEHQALIDFSGLAPVTYVDEVKVRASVPHNWQLLPFKQGALYAHAQWKSPSTYTGVGAVHVSMPWPLGDKAIVWLAKREYTNKANDGRIIREWIDDLGRTWFEAENNKYHVQGYVLTRGFNAWIVYFGYKTGYPPDLAELSIAARAAETFIPDPDAGPAPKAPADSDPVTAAASN